MSAAQYINLLQNLGFIIHPNKSLLTPTQKINFYKRFIIDSVKMTITVHSLLKQTKTSVILIITDKK